jgi:hypothetical protein
LAVYNPIHYQELPELFMDHICSLTGKSPSMVGFGSEGALTKGPFNALPPVIDVNNAMISAVLTEYGGFTTAAGHIGPNYRVDHDNSMLVPELWCRMRVFERDANFLIEHGYLEKVEDFDLGGRRVLAGRLGYRITTEFVDHFLGRIFEVPSAVFTEELLRPEKQNLEVFAAGVDAIVEAQRRVALHYFEDGTIKDACPPVKALLHLMAYGCYQGMCERDPRFRQMFTREHVIASDWYQDRLRAKQEHEVALWEHHRSALCRFLKSDGATPKHVDWQARLSGIRAEQERVGSEAYLRQLVGTIGLDRSTMQV